MPISDNTIGPDNPKTFADGTAFDWRQVPPEYATQAPESLSVTQSGSTTALTLHIGSEHLDDYLKAAIGWAEPYPTIGGVSGGGAAISKPESSGINRAMPLAHPRYWNMYCTGAESVQGVTFEKATDWTKSPAGNLPPINTGLMAPCYPYFPEYAVYKAKLGFANRSYDVLPNTYISSLQGSVTYYPPGTINSIVFNQVHPEWLRYTLLKIDPKYEMLSAQQGAYQFWVPPPLVVPGTVNPAGQIKLPYPSNRLTVTWFNVPYRFISGEGVYSYNGGLNTKTVFEYAAYTVNQNTFLGRGPGTLLFEGATASDPQVRPLPYYIEKAAGSGKYAPSNEYICDITLHFLYRDPPGAVNYLTRGYKPGGVGNKQTYNNVYAGHNLLPDAKTGKYYAAVLSLNADANNGVPPAPEAQNAIFQSFPHELLFTDPAWTMPYLP